MNSVAEERVKILLDRANKQKSTDVGTALRIAEAHNVALPDEYKVRICSDCRSLLHPDKNAEVRVSEGVVKYRCANCGSVNRHGY